MSRPSIDLLYDASEGTALPLPPELESVYGNTRFPPPHESRHVFANFVSTMDGVVSLGAPDRHRGGEISGFSDLDRIVMGLLRAVADFVLIGSGAVRALPEHVWTAECICPEMGTAYQMLRRALDKPPQPTTVIVSQNADLPAGARVFREDGPAPLILTNARGARTLEVRPIGSTQIVPVKPEGSLTPTEVLRALEQQRRPWILIEAGPRLVAEFLAAGCLDELFLTLSPQIAGRDDSEVRPGFVQGQLFAPENPVWGELLSVRRGGNHLFLRYGLRSGGL